MKIIDQIETARQKNNANWMDLLRLALRTDPKEARAILRKINAADQRISRLLGRLAKER